jgi:hypothetical protein
MSCEIRASNATSSSSRNNCLLVIIKDANVVYESWVQRHFIIDMSGTMVERIRSVGGIFKPVKSLKECPPSLRGRCGVFSPLAD